MFSILDVRGILDKPLLFPCRTFPMLHFFMLDFFHVALFPCCTFSVLLFFHVALFPCRTLFMLHCSMLHLFHVALFPCCTFFMLHFFHVAIMVLSFLVLCCNLFMLLVYYWKILKINGRQKTQPKSDLTLSTVNFVSLIFWYSITHFLLLYSFEWLIKWKGTNLLFCLERICWPRLETFKIR